MDSYEDNIVSLPYLTENVIDLIQFTDEMIASLEEEECNRKKRQLLVKDWVKTSANVPKRNHNQNSLIFIFHRDWNLVINMMIGVHKSIRAIWDMKECHFGHTAIAD